jgi:Gelsolin repeat
MHHPPRTTKAAMQEMPTSSSTRSRAERPQRFAMRSISGSAKSAARMRPLVRPCLLCSSTRSLKDEDHQPQSQGAVSSLTRQGSGPANTTLDHVNQSPASPCRHTQGAEGEALLALFPNGIKILEGGGASAMHAVEKKEPKLYCVSGKRKFKVSTVPLSGDSLNSRDGFVLDAGEDKLIVQWVNADATPAMKFRTLDLAEEIEQEYHGGHAQVRHTPPHTTSHHISNGT